ncbi:MULTISPECIES: hypothetical protein [unclassified Pseudomonas]|uniref:hypothetical protein n=1 Tax=unclassified Pseudomonas TaxID=196821 RepID=UPI00128B3C07|nr:MULTISPECIES: hypothetical protein [unclassified Pseudomonas]MPQ69555.1 hypothetical protein [Pseudomonas sp. MWU12-2323]
MNISEVFVYSMEGLSETDEDTSFEGVEALSHKMSELSRKVLHGEEVDIVASRVHTYSFAESVKAHSRNGDES